MNVDDLFKFGVTEKSGEHKGERFRVCGIKPTGVNVCLWGQTEPTETWKHGTYDIWQPPKTLFEDGDIEATWGNLKKAVETEGLPDDTLIIADPTILDIFSPVVPTVFSRHGANVRLVDHSVNGERRKAIMVF